MIPEKYTKTVWTGYLFYIIRNSQMYNAEKIGQGCWAMR